MPAQAISSVLRSPASQFHLLLLPYELSLPSDTVYADDRHAFQEVRGGGGEGAHAVQEVRVVPITGAISKDDTHRQLELPLTYTLTRTVCAPCVRRVCAVRCVLALSLPNPR